MVGGHIGTIQHALPEQGHDARVRVPEVLVEAWFPVQSSLAEPCNVMQIDGFEHMSTSDVSGSQPKGRFSREAIKSIGVQGNACCPLLWIVWEKAAEHSLIKGCSFVKMK